MRIDAVYGNNLATPVESSSESRLQYTCNNRSGRVAGAVSSTAPELAAGLHTGGYCGNRQGRRAGRARKPGRGDRFAPTERAFPIETSFQDCATLHPAIPQTKACLWGSRPWAIFGPSCREEVRRLNVGTRKGSPVLPAICVHAIALASLVFDMAPMSW